MTDERSLEIKHTNMTSTSDNNHNTQACCSELGDQSAISDDGHSHVKSQDEIAIAQTETRVVSCFRVLLMIAMLAMALVVSLTAYRITRDSEEGDFENAFENHANKVIDSFKAQGVKKTSAIITMAVALTSYAEHTNETWPFVTLPDFETRAALVNDLAEVLSLTVFPLVTAANMRKWGQYSAANQGWYAEGVAIQEAQHGAFSATQYNASQLKVRPVILQQTPENKYRPANATNAPFFPAWQYSPPVPVPIINFDFRTTPACRNELNFFVEQGIRRNVLSPAFEFSERGRTLSNAFLERSKLTDISYEKGPLSYFYVPVFEKVGDPESPLVAVLQAFIYWQTYLDNLLPDGHITVVLENDCGQTYTYKLSGAETEFMGSGDLHDTAYDYLEAVTDYGIMQGSAGAGCNYRIRVYPSKEMENEYLTNQPMIIALSMLGAVLTTILVFVAYDRFVERRQRLVMETAVQSTGVVSMLFPEEVRSRLYEKHKSSPKSSGRRGVLKIGAQTIYPPQEPAPSNSEVNPIADEYKNCTVLFADIAGFTQWSANRTPSHVFFLLETLYGAFDKQARKHSVFKVETIGDCYVAATGLPTPQDDHAFIMCKFAESCIVKMGHLVKSDTLVNTLGDDTSQLQLRVGLNSGPVTAGVLRGEKARFQLFGDTVNTAARMESNGQEGRIHVSQATADLLALTGKSVHLTAREDLVEAKGKGKMQCYWVGTSGLDASS